MPSELASGIPRLQGQLGFENQFPLNDEYLKVAGELTLVGRVQGWVQSPGRLHLLLQGPLPGLRGHLVKRLLRQILQDALLGGAVQLNLLLQQVRHIPARLVSLDRTMRLCT